MRLIFLIHLLILLTGFLGCQTIRFTKDPELLVPKLQKPTEKIKFALVLGSGGSRGLAHIGVLEVLEEEGLKPDLIIGCSAGSLIGAMYAAKQDSQWLKKTLLNQKAGSFFDFDFNDVFLSVSTNIHLRDFLLKTLPVKTFEELTIPYIAVATNLQTGKLTPFFTGQLTPAILASSAVPGIFKPIEMYGTYFIDGGVADPIPVQTARDLGAEVVVAVEIGQRLPSNPPNNLFDVLWRSMSINFEILSKQNAKLADINIDVPLGNVGMFTDSQNYEMYLLGKITAKRHIKEIKKVLRKYKN